MVERRKSEGVEGTEGVRGSALDEPANLGKSQGETKVTDDEGSAEGMGRARPGPTPTADEVERDDEVGTTDLIVPQAAHITARSARLDGSELAETSQNTPVPIQKPTSWDDHDVGLSAMQLVGLTGFEPATFCSQSRRATKLRYSPNVYICKQPLHYSARPRTTCWNPGFLHTPASVQWNQQSKNTLR